MLTKYKRWRKKLKHTCGKHTDPDQDSLPHISDAMNTCADSTAEMTDLFTVFMCSAAVCGVVVSPRQ